MAPHQHVQSNLQHRSTPGFDDSDAAMVAREIFPRTTKEGRTQVRGKKSRSSPRIRREPMRQDLEEALESIRYIAAHCAHESVMESIRDEWKFIAAVIDRLQFVIFSTVTIAGTLALFAQVRLSTFLPSASIPSLRRFLIS